MKVLLAALSALALAASPASAQTPTEAATAAAPQSAATAEKNSKAKDELLLPVQKITRWEDTGMTPVEAREWQTYAFTPHDATNWKHVGFTPLVARTWSDKGFDADEAREWLDSTKSSRTMMPDLDHSDQTAHRPAGHAGWRSQACRRRKAHCTWSGGHVGLGCPVHAGSRLASIRLDEYASNAARAAGKLAAFRPGVRA